jgi:hypothetical protein
MMILIAQEEFTLNATLMPRLAHQSRQRLYAFYFGSTSLRQQIHNVALHSCAARHPAICTAHDASADLLIIN